MSGLGKHQPLRASRRVLSPGAWRLSLFQAASEGHPRKAAFTLIELMVVIAIIGILAAIGLPAMRGFGKSNSLAAATRQLLDDFTLARQRAIASHTDVYVVFVPPSIASYPVASLTDANNRKVLTNLVSGQFTSYALFAFRSVGEQPGRINPRYLTPWRTLPEGMFIATRKYSPTWKPTLPDYDRPFQYLAIPFPAATNAPFALPAIVFDYQGRLRSGQDEIIPLARGSIFYNRDAGGNVVVGPADVAETPPGNSIASSNVVHIEWLTGRPRIENEQVQ